MLPAVATAQTSQDEVARTRLLEQAERAYNSGNHAEALDAARRAAEIRATPSVLLMIAQEHNTLGHTLDALEAAERCIRDTRADRHVPHRRRILTDATELRDALRRRVGFVSLRVPQPAPAGLRVRVQGSAVVEALWGVPYPVLPGSITVEASTDTGSFRREVSVTAGQELEVPVALTPNPAVTTTIPPEQQPQPAPATSNVSPPTIVPTPPSVDRAPPSERGLGAGPWIVAGAGVVALGAGVAFFIARNGAYDAHVAACTPTVCSDSDRQRAEALYNDAGTYNTLSNVLIPVGAAAVAGGVLWYVLARPRGERATRTALRWGVAPMHDGIMVGVGGTL